MGIKGFSSFGLLRRFSSCSPLLMEQVYGYSVSQVGFVSIARPLVFAISAPRGRLHDHPHRRALGQPGRGRVVACSP